MSNLDTILSVEEQDERGVYYEEVEQIVDGLIEQIKQHNTCPPMLPLLRLLHTAVKEASHTNHNDLCARVLKHSNYPTIRFYRETTGQDSNYTAKHWQGGRCPFPWRKLARAAMKEDCLASLRQHPEFVALSDQ